MGFMAQISFLASKGLMLQFCGSSKWILSQLCDQV